ncbi:MAG: sensor histidine kinase [Dehalococcoidia bacterium]|nr:sensor histidine kinase [Dehalococcoidia bacterium]
MQRIKALLSGYWLEAAVAIAALNGALEVALRKNATNAPDVSTWFGAPAVALMLLPLLVRRRWMFGAPTLVWMLAAALSFVDGRLVVFSGSVFAAGLAASFLLGNLPDATRSRLGLLVVLGGAATVAYNASNDASGNYVFLPAMFATPWVAGFAFQQRGARVEAAELRAARLVRDREEATRAAIAAERARIARELHDVLGHSLSVMTIQASAVRRLLTPDQTKERDALVAVERTGREALTEMRRLVGILRVEADAPELEPQPGLSHVSNLVDQARELGLAVELRVVGEPVPLPTGVDLTAYRLVQEGLTNVRKHSDASRAEVRLRYEEDGLEVEVCDDGKGAAAVDEGGHGLVGLRERVSIYGGEFEAGPRAEGGYRLRARLPVQS